MFEYMEKIALIGVFIPVSLLWFYVIMKLAKHTVGKDPVAWMMFLFLLISGPVGWVVIVLAFITDMFEKF